MIFTFSEGSSLHHIHEVAKEFEKKKDPITYRHTSNL